MSRQSVFIDEITADFLRASARPIFDEIAAGATRTAEAAATQRIAEVEAAHKTALDTAVAAARAEGAKAERERVSGIQQAGKGLGLDELVAKLIEDGVSLADANAQLLAETKAKGAQHLAALQGDENKLNPPTPAGAGAGEGGSAAKDAVALARKVGAIK